MKTTEEYIKALRVALIEMVNNEEDARKLMESVGRETGLSSTKIDKIGCVKNAERILAEEYKHDIKELTDEEIEQWYDDKIYMLSNQYTIFDILKKFYLFIIKRNLK